MKNTIQKNILAFSIALFVFFILPNNIFACATITDVSISESVVESGKLFSCKVTVTGSSAQMPSVGCGVSFDGGQPLNFCPSDSSFGGWHGNVAVFNCLIPNTNVQNAAKAQIVGNDFECDKAAKNPGTSMRKSIQLKVDPAKAGETPVQAAGQVDTVRQILQTLLGINQGNTSWNVSTSEQGAMPNAGGADGIVAAAKAIIDNLQVGNVWAGYYNKMINPPSSNGYTAQYREGNDTGVARSSIYWCTNTPIDAFNMAGYKGLGPQHQAVVNMDAYFKSSASQTSSPYTRLGANDIQQLKPGCAFFLEAVDGTHTGSEHTGIVASVNVTNGNGSITTYESNSTSKSHTFPVMNNVVKNTFYPLRGFGCVRASNSAPNITITGTPQVGSQTSQNPSTTPQQTGSNSNVNTSSVSDILKSIPGTSIVLLPTGETVEQNSGKQVPSASTIKLWIAATVGEESSNGNLNLDTKYTIKQSDSVSGTGILQSKVGQTFTLRQIFNFMLIYSDNTGTNILIDQLGGFYKINSYAQRNGYGQTLLQRRLADVGNANDNYTSARDGALFMQRLTKNEIVNANVSAMIMSALTERLRNTADQNFFGSNLGSVDYRHISGTGDTVSNEIGYVSTKNGKAIIAIFVADQPISIRPTIATKVKQIYDALSK
jgi:beta-lactamase class A